MLFLISLWAGGGGCSPAPPSIGCANDQTGHEAESGWKWYEALVMDCTHTAFSRSRNGLYTHTHTQHIPGAQERLSSQTYHNKYSPAVRTPSNWPLLHGCANHYVGLKLQAIAYNLTVTTTVLL